MSEIIAQFKQHGKMASFHYADDSCKEWGLGDIERHKAMKLYYDNPELQEQMAEIAKGFLWSLQGELKYGKVR